MKLVVFCLRFMRIILVHLVVFNGAVSDEKQYARDLFESRQYIEFVP